MNLVNELCPRYEWNLCEPSSGMSIIVIRFEEKKCHQILVQFQNTRFDYDSFSVLQILQAVRRTDRKTNR
jgi:hypothetical protein